VVAWLRNAPRDEWALCVPWRDKNVWHLFYPDFMVVREVHGSHVVDILDPHDHGRPDAPGKARGLSAYARDHGTGLGHIDLIAKVDGRMRVLHLEEEKTRKAVDLVTSNEMLLALYEQA
jgi:type III restriction enzyme